MAKTEKVLCPQCGTTETQTTHDDGRLTIGGNGKTIVFGLVEGRLSAYRCMKCGKIWLPASVKQAFNKGGKKPITLKPRFKVQGKRGPARNEAGEYIYGDLEPSDGQDPEAPIWVRIACQYCGHEQDREVSPKAIKYHTACDKCEKPLTKTVEDLKKIIIKKERLEFHDFETEHEDAYKTTCPKCGEVIRFHNPNNDDSVRMTCACGLKIEARIKKGEKKNEETI